MKINLTEITMKLEYACRVLEEYSTEIPSCDIDRFITAFPIYEHSSYEKIEQLIQNLSTDFIVLTVSEYFVLIDLSQIDTLKICKEDIIRFLKQHKK